MAKAKKIPVPNPGQGNPGSHAFGPGKVSSKKMNKAATTKQPKYKAK